MAGMTQLARAEDRAYDAYRAACAQLVSLETHLTGQGFDTSTNDEVSRLRRRAHAYRIQWEAAMRRREEREESISREAR